MTDFNDKLRRAWEVNIYHDLGIVCNGGSIGEIHPTGKSREATDLEIALWEALEKQTPQIPIVQISNNFDVSGYGYNNKEEPKFTDAIEKLALEGKFVWLANKYDICLYVKRDEWYKWTPVFNSIKKCRGT